MNESAKKTLKLINIQGNIKQFDDTYADGQTLFCKYCQHSDDHTRVHIALSYIWVLLNTN